jgi:hypothetical protein
MSKYDELTYKCRSELEQQMFPKCIRAKTTNVNDIQEEFKNMPIDKLKELMYLNDQEEKNFSFYNNGQQYVTGNYFNKANDIKYATTQKQKVELLFRYIKDTCGSVITPKIFKERVEKIFNLESEGMSENDYKDMMLDFFGKYQINLDNVEDKNKFESLVADDIQLEYVPVNNHIAEGVSVNESYFPEAESKKHSINLFDSNNRQQHNRRAYAEEV